METLPVSAQATVRSLADNMKTTCTNLAAITALSTSTAHRLAKLADASMDKLEDPDTDQERKGVEALNVATYGAISHNLSRTAVRLVTAGHRPEQDDQEGADTSDAKARLRKLMGL